MSNFFLAGTCFDLTRDVIHLSLWNSPTQKCLNPYTSHATGSGPADAAHSDVGCPAPSIRRQDVPEPIDSVDQAGNDGIDLLFLEMANLLDPRSGQLRAAGYGYWRHLCPTMATLWLNGISKANHWTRCSANTRKSI